MELKRVSGLLVACLLVASMAAACSSSKKSSVSAGSDQKTTTTTAASGGSGSGSGGSGSNASKSGVAGILSSSDCVQAAAAYAKVLTSAESAITGSKTDASDLNAEYSALGSKVPDSLKGDYKTVGDAYTKFANDIKGASLTDPSSYEKASADIDTSQVKAASQKISDYFDNHCQS
jgi:hypothetical protein